MPGRTSCSSRRLGGFCSKDPTPGAARIRIPCLTGIKGYFERFVRALEEEEKRRRGGELAAMTQEGAAQELSNLMRQSMADDKFWFNELIYSSFDGPDSMPWVQLRAMIPHLDDLATVSEAEVGDFVKMKTEP